MNIKTRLKRSESGVTEEGDFCLCNGGEPKYEFRRVSTKYDVYSTGKYVPYQHSEQSRLDRERRESEQPTPEQCEQCAKPIDKRLIIIIGVSGGPKLEITQ